MKTRDKVILGITVGVALLDGVLACSTYAKKKGTVIKDMVIKSIDDKIHKKDPEAEEEEIPIE